MTYLNKIKKQRKNENLKIWLLIITLIMAMAVVISTKAYVRLWQKGGILYEPQNAPQTEIKVQDTAKEPETPNLSLKTTKTTVVGVASWYDYELDGKEWSKEHLTCASRTLKRYSMARVTNIETGESVDCYVNDYIEHPDREIDLSSYAFTKIAPLSLGLIKVKIEQL